MNTQTLSDQAPAPVETETSVRRSPTPREVEALQHIADGCDSKTAARKMGISKRTVDFHLANFYTKLDASNRVQAINIARAKGYIK